METTGEEEFKEFVARNKRNVNGLLDKGKRTRQRALKDFDENLLSEKSDEILQKFWLIHLLKPLVNVYADSAEKGREFSIFITTKIIQRLGLGDEAEYIILGICGRMGKIPFPEESEEVRIEFLDLLELCLEKAPDQFLSKLSEVSIMLSKILLDNNPEMKNKAASFGEKLGEALSDKVGPKMKKVVVSLTENLKHQHSRVRISSLNGLRVVIGCKGAEEFLEDALPQLKMNINDRHHNVRRVGIEVIDYWLKNMDINATKKFEKDLLLFLLNGASDEIEEISEKSILILERHGNDMKEALIALGEEDGDEESKDAEMESEG